jgi:serine/threonine protein kinase
VSHYFLSENLDSGDAMLADFGLARLVDTIAAMTATTTTFAGTARFMAPELLLPAQAEGVKDALRTSKSDVYAFACLILQVGRLVNPLIRG